MFPSSPSCGFSFLIHEACLHVPSGPDVLPPFDLMESENSADVIKEIDICRKRFGHLTPADTVRNQSSSLHGTRLQIASSGFSCL